MPNFRGVKGGSPKSTRGGPRKGAGRPAKVGRGREGIPTCLRLSPAGRAWLDAQRKPGESLSDVIERMAEKKHG